MPSLQDGDLVLRGPLWVDLEPMVAMNQDAELAGNTQLPTPFTVERAREYLLDAEAQGWASGACLTWTIEISGADKEYVGLVEVRPDDCGGARVGCCGHPAQRGRGFLGRALRLVVTYCFDVLHLHVLRWQCLADDWASRRLAAAAGFHGEGILRDHMYLHGQWRSVWSASLLADESRGSRLWPPQPSLAGATGRGEAFVLRPFTDLDLRRIVEAVCDDESERWLIGLPHPYNPEDAQAYVRQMREQWALQSIGTWCISNERLECLGSIEIRGLDDPSSACEVGYWLHPEARGRGLMTAAVALLCEEAVARGWAAALMIRTAAGNIASQHVALRNGFVKTGVWPGAAITSDGERTDLYYYTRLPEPTTGDD